MDNEPFLLRVFWGVVSEMPGQQLQNLSSTALLSALLHQVSLQVRLTAEEVEFLCRYITHRVPLIRDIADACPAQGLVMGNYYRPAVVA
jgi:hypothetical protein